jgi:hypothetical protein
MRAAMFLDESTPSATCFCAARVLFGSSAFFLDSPRSRRHFESCSRHYFFLFEKQREQFERNKCQTGDFDQN